MFGRIFDMDNAFWRAMNKVADIFILNVLFIVFSIPIVTIGASATAMYTVALKMVRDEDSYIIRGFWKAFKSNFKQSTIIWLIMLFVGAFLGLDLYLTSNIDTSVMNVLRYVFYFIAAIYAIMLSFVFPLQCKFENTVVNTLKNSLLMGIAHFIPWTLLILILNVIPIVVLLFFTTIFMAAGLPIMLICGFAAIAYFNCKMFNRIFKRYIPDENEEDSSAEIASEEDTIEETESEEPVIEEKSQNIMERLDALNQAEEQE